MSEPDEWRIAWSDAVKTPSSVVAHADDRFTFERHLLDWMRTRIKPGADPRVPWERSHGFGQFETGTRALPRAVSIITASRTDGYRYVPEDVRRWRNSAHRAALAERARAHAAIIPGNRATMEVER